MKYLITLTVFISIIINFSCAPQRAVITTHEEPTPEEKADVTEIIETKTNWIENTLEKLTLEEKIGQMIMPRAYGYFTNTESDEYQIMLKLVQEKKVGGFCFFQGDVYATAITINKLQEQSNIPLLIAADFERGGPMRIRRMTPFPEAMALGASRRADLAYKMGEIVARESRAIGIHINFAPVVDVNNNPDNPVINTRSYGESPELVAEIASAYMKGMQQNGLIATAKHFPGHGDTDVDSHYDLPVLNVTRPRLDSIELYPFKKLIEQGLMAIMTAHIAIPSIDKKNLPASLSKNITTKILKEELGFEGLVFTDALEMRGVTKLFNVSDAAIAAVEAGADVLLLPPDEYFAIDALVEAVKSGRISENRINESVKKILAYKQWLKLDEEKLIDLNKISDIVSTPFNWQVAKEIAQAAITVPVNKSAIPIRNLRNSLVLIITDTEDYRTDINRSGNPNPNERAGDYLLSQLRARASNFKTIRISPQTTQAELNNILSQSNNYKNIICALFIKMRSRTNPFGISQQVIDFLNSLTTSKPKNQKVILISLGNPYTTGTIPNADAILLAYSDTELSTESAVEVLFGEIKASGVLPINIPDFTSPSRKILFTYGTGARIPKTTLHEEKHFAERGVFQNIDSIILDAIKERAFPGCQLLVVKDGEIVLNRNYGSLGYSKNFSPVTDSTIYDLASLTKVVGTTSAIMKLVDSGLISLDDKVAKYIPEFTSHGKDKITIKNLLLHNSGLPAYQKFYLTCKTAKEVIDSIYNSSLIYNVGDSTVYSDLGFIVLGKLIEQVTGLSLDEYLKREFFEPLGMYNTLFNPPESILHRVAPTEEDTLWRKKLVHGAVHDETAALLNGVAGHAGLFSNALDLAKFTQMILSGGSYADVKFLKPETVKLFTERTDNTQKRGLGWDFKSTNGYSSAGKLFSPKSFGHTGFTGTSIWIDPKRNVFVIFLTNRVHPSRSNNKIQNIRPALHDAIMEIFK